MTAKFLEFCSYEVFHFCDNESMKRHFSFYSYILFSHLLLFEIFSLNSIERDFCIPVALHLSTNFITTSTARIFLISL